MVVRAAPVPEGGWHDGRRRRASQTRSRAALADVSGRRLLKPAGGGGGAPTPIAYHDRQRAKLRVGQATLAKVVHRRVNPAERTLSTKYRRKTTATTKRWPAVRFSWRTACGRVLPPHTRSTFSRKEVFTIMISSSCFL